MNRTLDDHGQRGKRVALDHADHLTREDKVSAERRTIAHIDGRAADAEEARDERQVLERRDDGQTADKFGDEPELQQILRFALPQQFAGLALLGRGSDRLISKR